MKSLMFLQPFLPYCNSSGNRITSHPLHIAACNTQVLSKENMNMKSLTRMLAGLCAFAAIACNSTSEVTGNIDVYEGFQSKFVAPRTVRVWTPADYNPKTVYDVIYMHDGQNLFDASITWNGQEWGVDETLAGLMKEELIRPCIVVGIDCGSLRYEEYYPSAICAAIPEGVLPEGFTPLGDEYLKFVVEELKPFIDSTYSTWGDAEHTFVSGSSCGGLISSYALCEYPDVFSGAACLSTHSNLWNPHTDADQTPAADAYREYLRMNLPADASHRLYMDCGDMTIDAGYDKTQEAINEMISSLDWKHEDGSDAYMYKFFPGHAHTETDWNARFEIPVLYLLGLKSQM